MKLKKTALCIAITLTVLTAKAQQIEGDWKGSVNIQGTELELIFHISEKEGVLVTTLDVPMQGASAIPVEKTTFENGQLQLNLQTLQAKFSGKLLSDNSIKGEFIQMELTLPLVLKKFESKLPGNTALVSTDEELKKLISTEKGEYKYKVEDYFSRPKASNFLLSPDGKYMSYREKEEGTTKRHIYIKEIATVKVSGIIEEKEELIRAYFNAYYI